MSFLHAPTQMRRYTPLGNMRIFVGKVVDNADPKALNRVRCTIDGLLLGDPSTLPWLHQCAPMGQGSGMGVSVQTVPSVGNEVLVFFPNSIYHGFYFARLIRTGNQLNMSMPSNYKADQRYGFADKNGNIFTADMEDRKALFKWNGAKIYIDDSGNIHLDANEVFINTGTSPDEL